MGAYDARIVKFLPRAVDMKRALQSVDESDEEFSYSTESESGSEMSLEDMKTTDKVLDMIKTRKLLLMPRLKLPEVAVNQVEADEQQVRSLSLKDGSGVVDSYTSPSHGYWLRSLDREGSPVKRIRL